jgi:hypothetical protein
MKTIFVLGLGETLKFFRDFDSPKIGVNDIWAKVKTEMVVCVDPPRRFTASRLAVIKTCTPKMFYSNIDDWKEFKDCFYWKTATHGIIKDQPFNENHIYHSVNSPFIACNLAYHLGAQQIVMYGVDFLSHSKLKGTLIMEKILKDFSWLNENYKKRGVTLYVGHAGSRLAEILPLWSDKTSLNLPQVTPLADIANFENN